MTIAIVEDESRTRAFLRELITEHHPWLTVMGEAQSVQEAMSLFAVNQPDILLLDVELQDGTGFDLLDTLQMRTTKVIFITAYGHYAIKAIRADALDYLEKPVNPLEFSAALIRARQQKDSVQPNPVSTNAMPQRSKRIAVPTSVGLRYLQVAEISHVEADGSYCEIHFLTGEKSLVISRKLKEVFATLEPMGFVRPNRSCIVNLNAIQEVRKTDGGSLVLKSAAVISLSKRFKEEALSALYDQSQLLG